MSNRFSSEHEGRTDSSDGAGRRDASRDRLRPGEAAPYVESFEEVVPGQPAAWQQGAPAQQGGLQAPPASPVPQQVPDITLMGRPLAASPAQPGQAQPSWDGRQAAPAPSAQRGPIPQQAGGTTVPAADPSLPYQQGAPQQGGAHDPRQPGAYQPQAAPQWGAAQPCPPAGMPVPLQASAGQGSRSKRRAQGDGQGRAGGSGGSGGGGRRRGGSDEGDGGSRQMTISRRGFAVILALVAVVGALVATLVSMLRSSSGKKTLETDTGTIDATTDTWVDPYDWDKMGNDEQSGLLAYYDADGTKLSEAGVDVSEHDGTIDWQQAKAAGVEFAIVRVGYRGYSQGSINLDEQFYSNISGASEAGIKVGAYFFSQAVTAEEATEEANYVVDCLKNAGVELSYPVAFDEELNPGGSGVSARTDGLSTSQLTQNAQAYLSVITSAGYRGMIYGNQNDLARLDLTGDLAQYPIWYAEYEVDHPTGHYDMEVWQYRSTGLVSGINEGERATDLDIRFIADDSWSGNA